MQGNKDNLTKYKMTTVQNSDRTLYGAKKVQSYTGTSYMLVLFHFCSAELKFKSKYLNRS